MSTPAQVRSTAAIEAFRLALVRFQERVQNAIDSLDGELHRASNWVEHDRPSHWKNQTHAAEDAVHQAKLDLERCLMMTVAGERPACREQRAALVAAKMRRAYCQEKSDAVRRWQRSFRHEQFEYDGRIGQLRRTMELDVPKAAALLKTILRRLEEYQIEHAPELRAPIESVDGAGADSAATRPAVAALPTDDTTLTTPQRNASG